MTVFMQDSADDAHRGIAAVWDFRAARDKIGIRMKGFKDAQRKIRTKQRSEGRGRSRGGSRSRSKDRGGDRQRQRHGQEQRHEQRQSRSVEVGMTIEVS
ncbi:hypothetical protein AOQ84DRAFT_130465 [Glonium stellatum]|uniref:Uncharacterized protein n=1 Tax=Glonium stellatum TaxID=574774 RepID=A0A8E2ESD3_9PEZI|nr:hypothetical protein AOQ84DRAFT_130465 [Glonium stellatum]